MRVKWFLGTSTVLASLLLGLSRLASAAEEAQKPELIPVDPAAIAAREKSLTETAPGGATLVAYLDCGTQLQSTTTKRVTVALLSGTAYRFQSEAAGVLPTQPTIFFDTSEVVFRISGLDRAHRYTVGLTWWDYDNGSRSQSVIVGSPDGRLVRLAVPAIRLPSYKDDGQPPAERRFSLPVAFARNGQMQLTVRRDTGANAVISEVWIWQLD